MTYEQHPKFTAIEKHVELGEFHAARYDAWGDPEDLDLAIQHEKAAFRLRNEMETELGNLNTAA